MAEKTVAPTVAQETPTTEVAQTRERYIAPPVDIYETSDGLVVTADIPGVTQEGLDVRVDNRVLTIQGRSRHLAPGEPVHREYELVHYFRQFELSDEVDVEKIAAELKHGVLTLHLAKAAAAKPRQIPVQVG